MRWPLKRRCLTAQANRVLFQRHQVAVELIEVLMALYQEFFDISSVLDCPLPLLMAGAFRCLHFQTAQRMAFATGAPLKRT